MENITKRKNNTAKIAISILITIVIVLAGYIVYDKFISNESSTNNSSTINKEQNVETKVTSITEEEKNLLMSQIETYVSYYAPKFNNFDISNFTNNDILIFAIQNDKSNNHTKESLQQVINKYFENKTVNFTNIICPDDNKIIYDYNATNGIYTYNDNHPGHGGGTTYRSSNHYVESSIKNNIYTFKVKILHGNTCGDTCGPIFSYYKNIEDALNNQNALIYVNPEDDEVKESDYQAVEESLPITTFVFEKTANGNFSLSKVKVD